jgi:hypothetical protein
LDLKLSVNLAYGTDCRDYGSIWSSAGVQNIISTTTIVPSGTWYHLAFVYSGTTASFYINGTLSTSISTFLASSTINTTRLYNNIGRNPSGSFANAQLDEIKLYNRGLSAAQVLVDYATVGISSTFF